MDPKDLTALGGEIKEFTEVASRRMAETNARLIAIEQRITAPTGGLLDGSGGGTNDIGYTVIDSPQYKSFAAGNGGRSGRIQIGSFHKTAIVNATGLNQPLVQAYRVPGVVEPGRQPLGIRDLLPSYPTTSNMIEFCRELSFTNNAAMQTAEGVAKGESAATFELAYSPVQTLAHWIPASRQVMEDSTAMQAYLNNRMMYALKQKENDELLNGSGTGTNLVGLITSATTYDTNQTVIASDTFIDVIAHAIDQVYSGSLFPAEAIVMNHNDWARIRLIKTSGSGADGTYIFSDPRFANQPQLWGLPVVVTPQMPESQFLVGNFTQAAAIWDRGQATIELSREHDDFFTRNLVAVLAEERLALTIFNAKCLIYGGFPFGS
jgi:HK97 family phage major capsid protein